MSPRRPLIVATLPGRSLRAVREQLRRAKETGADLAEVRVDRLDPSEFGQLSDLFPAPMPLVATLRSRAEGGEGPDTASLRVPILERLGAFPFAWIDLEVRRDLPLPGSFPPPTTLGRIYSNHPGRTEPRQWEDLLRQLDGLDGIGKLVVPSSVKDLFETLVPLLERRRATDLVVHTTGPSGPILRALSARFGFPLAYASLPEEEAGPAVEPSQIPVPVLRPFLEGPANAPLFAVVGHPIDRSRSPSVHQRWIAEAGRAGLYLALDLEDERSFVEAIPGLPGLGFRGINVTHPYKRAAWDASDELGAGARAVGACNTMTWTPEGAVGENTDLAAILRRLSELRDEERWDGGPLAVLGAGGAARATLAAARELGVPSTVYARDRSMAGSLAREFGATAGAPEAPSPAGLVVHATTVGGSSDEPLGLPLGRVVRVGGHVLDWVYAARTAIIADAAAHAGATYEDGWRLFVYQAAASFALWWGAPPSERAVRTALEARPCAA